MALKKNIALFHPAMHLPSSATTLAFWTAEELVQRGVTPLVFAEKAHETIAGAESLLVPFLRNGARGKNARMRVVTALLECDAVIAYGRDALLPYARIAAAGVPLPPSLWYADEEEGRASSAAERTAVRAFHCVAASSRRSADAVTALFNRDATVIYPGAPKRGVEKTSEERKDDYFLFVGALSEERNIFAAVSAFYEFKRMTKRKSTTLAIVGEGRERARVARIAERLGMSADVDFLGAVSHDALSKLYRKAEGVLNVPLNEPFGLITFEAWAHSAPLILSTTAGSAEIAKNNETALLVDPRNPLSIAHAMKRVFVDKRLSLALGEKGRRTLGKDFSVREYVDRLFALVRSA